MKHSYSFEVTPSVFSIFDLSGTISFRNGLTYGLEKDMQKLQNDQITLENDYRKACHRILDEVNQS